jgi:hypothetical protein
MTYGPAILDSDKRHDRPRGSLGEINRFNFESVRSACRVPEEYLKQLKFSECLPPPYAKEMLKDRLLQRGYLETILVTKKKICVR